MNLTFARRLLLVWIAFSVNLVPLGAAKDSGLECGNEQFKCVDDSHCIPLGWKCDGDVDCDDKSDEHSCLRDNCTNSEFQCPSGKCIPLRWLCDGEEDCGADKADEINCANRTCKPNEFTCQNKGQCIPDKWKCDGHGDCSDSSDEVGCNMTCSMEEFSCSSGKCISKQWRCDQEDDCGDNSDELGCPNFTCSANEFTCGNGRCIPNRYRCDLDQDCPDGSDEHNCPENAEHKRSTSCGSREWTCHNGDCIHMSWRCDHSFDCLDHSDEINCTRRCRNDQWQCKLNQECIPVSMRCNGDVECKDGTDEIDCHVATTSTTAKPELNDCPNGMFRCNNTGKCVAENRVCDGTDDCGDWSDEPISCNVNECSSKIAHSCSQLCIDDVIGYHCGCYHGYKLGNDSKVCVDIDECTEIDGTCSGHKCNNTKGHFKCECYEGYELSEHRFCKAKGNDKASLVFLNRHDVRQLNLADSTSQHQHYTALYSNLQAAIVFDFNLKQNYMIWSDVADEKIYIAVLDKSRPSSFVGANYSVLIGDDLLNVDGIAIDWIHDLVYWTDTGKNTIEVASVRKPSDRTTIISTNLDEPRGIVLNVMESFMVWADWGEEARIELALQDGSNRRTLVNTNIVWPNGIAIDYVVKRIYWVDAKLNSIQSCDYHGENRKVILSSSKYVSHPFSVSVFEDAMYWSDWNLESILRANKFSAKDSDVKVIVENVNDPMDLKVVHSYKQPSAQKRCTLHKCSHLCLPNGDKSYVCTCPSHLQLSADTKTCVAKLTTTTVPTHVYTKAPKTITTTSRPSTAHLPPVEPTATSHKTAVLPTEKTEFVSNGSATVALAAANAVPERDSHVLFIIVCLFVIFSVVIITLAFIVYRNYQRRNITAMNFDNPVYRKTTEEQFVLEKSDECVNSYPSSMEPLTRPGTNDFV